MARRIDHGCQICANQAGQIRLPARVQFVRRCLKAGKGVAQVDRNEAARRGMRMMARLAHTSPGLHGVMLSLRGETVLECYFYPGEMGRPHKLYSVSKSVTALAVGLLAGRGALALDRPALTYLPEWNRLSVTEEARRTTLRDLLRMTTCHDRRAYDPEKDDNWAKRYFEAPAQHPPGTVFGYDASGTQVLALICKRITGRPLLDFLQEELFDPLGAKDEKSWAVDPSGVEQGGSGLSMTLRDMSRVANFCLTDGLGLVPAAYLASATSFQTATGDRLNREERWGYGYQFWMTRRGFSMYGMRGQLAVMVPDEGLVLCTQGDTEDVQSIYDAFFDAMVEDNGKETE